MKKLVVFLLLFSLLLIGCGAAETEKIDYEAEALRKAQEDWAAQSETDPLGSFIDGMMGTSTADSWESLIYSKSGNYSIFSIESLLRTALCDVSLDSGLLDSALDAAEDPEAQERIRAELQWGRPKQLVFTDPEDPEGAVRFELSYDEAAQLSSVCFSRGSSDSSSIMITFAYDQSGNLIEKKIEDGEDWQYVCTNIYDDDGRLVQRDMDANGYTAQFHWEYDRYGNLSLCESTVDGSESSIMATWNERGDLLLLEGKSSEGTLSSGIPHWESDDAGYTMSIEINGNQFSVNGTYDEGHRVVSSSAIQGDSTTGNSSKKYGEYGGLVWYSTETMTPNVVTKAEYSYNVYGSLISMVQSTSRNGDTEILSCVYHHDEFGRCDSISMRMYGEELTAQLIY